MRIRRATIDDAYAISKVHVNSWKTTYKNLISGSYLSQLSIEKRKKNWEWTFHHPNQDEVTFVAITNDGKTVGFSNGGHNLIETKNLNMMENCTNNKCDTCKSIILYGISYKAEPNFAKICTMNHTK